MKTIVTLTPIGAFQCRAAMIGRAGLPLRRYRGMQHPTEESLSICAHLESQQDELRRMKPEDFTTHELDGKVQSDAEILRLVGFNPKKANFRRMVKEVAYA
jgi:hypothetical protein